MNQQIPKRLGKEPLIEAIWQIYFDVPQDDAIGEILPGIVFAALGEDYPQRQRLPAADIPPRVTGVDQNLRYLAKFRMQSPDSPFLINIGDRVITLNCRRPYSGWVGFKQRIAILIAELEKSSLIPEIQRHSLRYIDLLQLEPPPSLRSLTMTVRMADYKVETDPLQMRVELTDTDCRHVVQVVTPAEVRLPANEVARGSLIDIETVAAPPPSNWEQVRNQLDGLHSASKRAFFDLLTKDAVERLEPEYEEPGNV